MKSNPSYIDFILRVAGSFALLGGLLLCLMGAIGYLLAGQFHLTKPGVVLEAILLGVPTILVLFYILKTVFQVESDPENR